MEHYLALKREEIQWHAVTWRNHENNMLCKYASHQRTNTADPSYVGPGRSQVHRQGVEGLGEGGQGLEI